MPREMGVTDREHFETHGWVRVRHAFSAREAAGSTRIFFCNGGDRRAIPPFVLTESGA